MSRQSPKSGSDKVSEPSTSETAKFLQVQKTSFFGRLGSRTASSTDGLCLSKQDTGVSSQLLSALRFQLSYDEEYYSAGVDVGFFAFLFDHELGYLDCIFYRHPEDANGGFYLNGDTGSLTINLNDMAASCCVIVIALATDTTGLSITELKDAEIEVSAGFLGSTLSTIVFEDTQNNQEVKPGAIFFALAEYAGSWFYREMKQFTSSGSLSGLLHPSKAVASDMLVEVALQGRSKVAKPLSSLLREKQKKGLSSPYADMGARNSGELTKSSPRSNADLGNRESDISRRFFTKAESLQPASEIRSLSPSDAVWKKDIERRLERIETFLQERQR